MCRGDEVMPPSDAELAESAELAGGYTWGITMDELVDLHWQTIDAATGLVTPGR